MKVIQSNSINSGVVISAVEEKKIRHMMEVNEDKLTVPRR